MEFRRKRSKRRIPLISDRSNWPFGEIIGPRGTPMPRNPPSERKFTRKVVKIVTDHPLVHFHLACGHLITEHKNDLAGKSSTPSEMECWACAAENDE